MTRDKIKNYENTINSHGVDIIAKISKKNSFDVSKLPDVQKEIHRGVLLDLINYTTLALIELENSTAV